MQQKPARGLHRRLFRRLPDDLPARLLAGLKTAAIAVANDGERQQHLCLALSSPELLPSLGRYLDQGNRSVHGWLRKENVTSITFPGAGEAFANINRASEPPAQS